MFLPRALSVLISRDAIADAAAAAAMKAYQDGIAYAIAFIILYLTLTLSVLALVGFMGFIASTRVRRSPVFAVLVFTCLLCIAAAAVNISQNRDLVVRPTDGVDRIRYTSLITLSLFIPYFCDFTLILRLLAFYPRGSAPRWKPALVIAYPALVKIPRFVYIVMYIHFVWQSTYNAADMNTIVYRVNQKQYAVVEWSLMLSDQLYCTSFLMYKLYSLGWGWGDEKHVGGSLLSTLRTIMYSALASFAVPSFFLISLIVMQSTHYRPDLMGYVFATNNHLCIAGAAFACLWPAIRADRRSRRSAGNHSSSCNNSHTCPNCGGDVEYEVSKGGAILTQRSKTAHRQSLRKSASVTTSGEDLLEAGQPPFLSYNRGRSGSVLSNATRKLPPYAPGIGGSPKTVDEEAGIEMSRHVAPTSIEQEQEHISDSGEKHCSSDEDDAIFVVGHDQVSSLPQAVGGHAGETVRSNLGHGQSEMQRPATAPLAHTRPTRSGSVGHDASKAMHGRMHSVNDGDVALATRSAPHHHAITSSRQGSAGGLTGTVRNGCMRNEKGRAANPVDLSGILIVTTEEQWSSQ